MPPNQRMDQPSLNIRRGLVAAGLGAVAGALVPALVLPFHGVAELWLFPAFGCAAVLGSAAWATHAPSGSWSFARSLLIIFVASVSSWYLVSWMDGWLQLHWLLLMLVPAAATAQVLVTIRLWRNTKFARWIPSTQRFLDTFRSWKSSSVYIGGLLVAAVIATGVILFTRPIAGLAEIHEITERWAAAANRGDQDALAKDPILEKHPNTAVFLIKNTWLRSDYRVSACRNGSGGRQLEPTNVVTHLGLIKTKSGEIGLGFQLDQETGRLTFVRHEIFFLRYKPR